uniref:Putative secreted protein n=1 Tax=Ixodes ricinus TaxID=34613 RepID=A0A147BM70_IXORI
MPPVGPLVAALSLPLVQSGSRPCCRPEPSRMDPHNPPPPRARRRHQYTRHPKGRQPTPHSPTITDAGQGMRSEEEGEGGYLQTHHSITWFHGPGPAPRWMSARSE